MANPRARLVDLLTELTDEEADMLLEVLTELQAKPDKNSAIDDAEAEAQKLPAAIRAR